MSIDREMDKEDVVHIYTMEYYSAIKKNEITPLAATWMDLEIIILNEVGQKEQDKYHMTSLICGIQNMVQDFPGGAVVKNPPANAEDTGSSPGPRRFHMPWNN